MTDPRPNFPELDVYERHAARRVGAAAAHELRREIEAHLTADVAARQDSGLSPSEARSAALAALGDLRQAARAERSASQGLGRILLFAAPWFATTAWYLPQLIVMRTGMIAPEVPAFLWCAFVGSILAGTLLVRRIVVATIVFAALACVAVLLLGMTDGGHRWGRTYVISSVAGVALFGFVLAMVSHLVVALLVFGIPGLRRPTSPQLHA